ncbi:MAG: hypothetical protein JWS12_73 [Candidatus Saccharibacteria bacterium]|nr:hypothetical protein [Candidatus Saccharibacteria bacterium]
MRRQLKQNQKYLLGFIVLVCLYAGLTVLLPPDPILYSRYHLTDAGIRFINLSFVLPIIGIWCVAFYGALQVKHYALLIKNTADGKPLDKLADGLVILVSSSPLTSSLASFSNYIGRVHPRFQPTGRIISNYIGAIVIFIAFWLISNAASSLSGQVKKKSSPLEQQYWVFGFIVLSTIYCFLLITQRAPSEPHDPYFLPNWLLLMTLAIPYLYIWYRGLLAAYNLLFYQKKVKGSLYKQGLSHLAKGLVSVIAISILIQLLTTASVRLNRLKLTPILIIVYILLILYAIAYGYIAKGANRLKKIEEV